MLDLRDKVLKLIKESNKKACQIETDLELKTGTVGDWKRGKGNSFNKYIPEIAEYFGVTTNYLLGQEDIKKEAPATAQELSEVETFIVSVFRAMNEADREHFVWMVERAIVNQPIDEQANNRQLIALEVQRQYAEQMNLRKESREDSQG